MTQPPSLPSATDASALQALERVLLDARDLGGADLRARLRWLEAAAVAADAVALDDEGRAGALHVRAALGAIVKWSQGPKDADSLVALDALVRMLTARGYLAMVRSLAAAYDVLVDARAPHRAACAEARDVLRALATTIEKGQPPPHAVAGRLVAIAAATPAPPDPSSLPSSSSSSPLPSSPSPSSPSPSSSKR